MFTFVPSPAAFFSREAAKDLSTIAEKRMIFENAGVDYLIEYPFYQEIADMEPEAYIKEVLGLADTIKDLSKIYTYARNFLYLGRGYNYPTALEGALKLNTVTGKGCRIWI